MNYRIRVIGLGTIGLWELFIVMTHNFVIIIVYIKLHITDDNFEEFIDYIFSFNRLFAQIVSKYNQIELNLFETSVKSILKSVSNCH